MNNEQPDFTPPPAQPGASEVLAQLVALQRDAMAEIAALRAAVHALCASHPAPERALEVLLEAMDLYADVTPAARVPIYRQAIQQYQATLQSAIRR